MILSDQGIRRALEQGELEIDPKPEPDQYTTSAVDIFLGDKFQEWDSKLKVKGLAPLLNLADQEFQKTATAFVIKVEREKDGSVVLPPYDPSSCHPMLAMTRERLHLKLGSRLAARVEGRSSLARIGLMVHLTAPTIHAGFNGYITLEMVNHGPFYLKLVPNKTRICQLIFERLEGVPEGEINTGFQGQTMPAGTGAG